MIVGQHNTNDDPHHLLIVALRVVLDGVVRCPLLAASGGCNPLPF